MTFKLQRSEVSGSSMRYSWLSGTGLLFSDAMPAASSIGWTVVVVCQCLSRIGSICFNLPAADKEYMFALKSKNLVISSNF